MNYLIEAILISLYSLTLYIPLNYFFKNVYLIFFLTGFLKHFLGHYTGVNAVYCRIYNLQLTKVPILQLVKESIIYGLIYLIGGEILNKLHEVNKLTVFMFGFILNIVLEMTEINKSFSNKKCTA